MPDKDIRELDRRAVERSVEIVSGVATADLARQTPCEGWTIADLLGHMTVQHSGFAAAAEGCGADPSVWRVPAPSADPVADYATAAQRVTAAFAAADVVRDRFALAEFGDGAVFPAMQAIGFHFIDYIVHGWDVARSIDVDYRPDDDLLDTAVTIARAVPTGDARTREGAAFKPVIEVSDDVDPWVQTLTILGRSPSWTPDALA